MGETKMTNKEIQSALNKHKTINEQGEGMRWKYNLDIASPYIATIKTPYISSLERMLNDYHFGLRLDLKMMCPFKLSKDGKIRYKGQYWITKTGRIKVRFQINPNGEK